MATIPTARLNIIQEFGPIAPIPGDARWKPRPTGQAGEDPCCFCGMQCGISSKVKDNQVIGFEPWKSFLSTRACLSQGG